MSALCRIYGHLMELDECRVCHWLDPQLSERYEAQYWAALHYWDDDEDEMRP